MVVFIVTNKYKKPTITTQMCLLLVCGGYYNMFRSNGTIFMVYIYPNLLIRYTYVYLFLFVLSVLV